jgi:hypothetical protein
VFANAQRQQVAVNARVRAGTAWSFQPCADGSNSLTKSTLG